MKIINEPKLDFDNVLIRPCPTELQSRSEVNLSVSYICKHSRSILKGFPLIVSNMTCVGTIEMAKALYNYEIFVSLHKFIEKDKLIEFFNNPESIYSFYTLGMNKEELSKLEEVERKSSFLNKICLDAANGYMYSFLDKIKLLRDLYPNKIIMAGNVATPEGVENIIKAGADVAKCGIANGGFCETKTKAAIGYKQFSMAVECGQAANELNALCCSDGGCKTSADICKALGTGSQFVMCGSMFAGYDECDSDWQYDEDANKVAMLMYGMSSKTANDKYCGGLKEYRAAEGREGWVNYKGPIKNLAVEIRGGVASCCTYTNTKNLENLWKNCVFTVM